MKNILNFLAGVLSSAMLTVGLGSVLYYIGLMVCKHIFHIPSIGNYYLYVAALIGIGAVALLVVFVSGLFASFLFPLIARLGERSIKFCLKRFYDIKAFFRQDTKIK